uniref:RRM domain-containing protein n=1 Tax=Sus scrofa TaxID=9823 RepID=A0A8D1V2K1_PIG
EMQATAVVKTAAGKGYRADGGNAQKDEPARPQRGYLLLSPSGSKEAQLTLLDDWDPLALGKSASDNEISSIGKTDLLAPSLSVSPDTDVERAHSKSSEFEDSTDYAVLNETYSVHYSESKLQKSLMPLNSELDSELQKKEEMFFDILEHQGNKAFGLERICKNSDDDYNETTEEMLKHDADGDSQQEYHSAEEQEYISNHLYFDQTETLNISNLEVLALRNPSNREENHVKLKSNSGISFDSVDTYGQEESPHVSTFGNSVMLREYQAPECGKCEEQETSVMYHTAFDGIVLRSSPPDPQASPSESGFFNPQKALKTRIYPGKMKSQIAESKDFGGNSVVENRMLQHLENPSTLPQDRDLETRLVKTQPRKDCQTSWTSIFDDSADSACGHSHYKSLQNTPNPALDSSVSLPRSASRGNQAVEEGGCPKMASGSAAHQARFHHADAPRPESVTEGARGSVTVNQTVDVSTDFRACFTTSRATSARSSVVSTSSNTEVTMMSKKRPGEWQRERRRSVACDAEESYSHGDADPQTAVAKGPLGKSLSVGSLKPNGNFLNKDSLEVRKAFDITDLSKPSEREPQLTKEAEKTLPSKCCEQIMQRAVQAESHLLNVHYQMCHQHCSDIYKLLMDNREVLDRSLSSNSTKKELGSALLSVLGDLKVRYVNLKEKINKGVPLEELPPLSLESKLLSAFSTFASRLMKKESHVFSGEDSERDHQSTHDVDVSSSLETAHSQASVSSEGGCPEQDAAPTEAVLHRADSDAGLSRLRLDGEDSRNYREISEDWFDAKENLTGADFTGEQERQIEQDSGDPASTQERKSVAALPRDEGYLVHVGGLCPSLSEADLRSHFQKYEISDISIYDSSPNYRYASLALKKNDDAKMAVKEMNDIEINGKSVNVWLVKTPAECTAPLSSKNGNKVSFNNLEKSISKEINSASSLSRLPRTRPRHLGSEQDSEFFPFDQKGVKKNCKQIESAKLLPDTPIQFLPPNTLNLRSLTKIMKRLTELYPEVSRDRIIDALQEVRLNHRGFLHGLSISTIVEMTSSVLENSASKSSKR